MTRPVFVVSTGRSGSTLVSNMLREHPDLLSLSEFFVMMREAAFPEGPITGEQFWEIVGMPKATLTALLRSGVHMEELLYRPGPGTRFTAETGVPAILLVTLPHLVANPEALYDELAAWVPGLDEQLAGVQYRRLFKWLCRRLGRRVWVERSGVSTPMIRDLATMFPEAGFVHLHRDGRECAVSMSLHPGFKLLALQSRPDLAPADIYDANGLNGAALERLRVPPSILGAVWSDMTLAAVADLAALGHVTELGYEDLVGDPHRHLRRLADFIGVEADPAWLARASALIQERPPRWTVLDDAERQRLEEAVAPAMTRLGRTAVT